MSDIVKLDIKISGSDSFKEVELSAKDLVDGLGKVFGRQHRETHSEGDVRKVLEGEKGTGAGVVVT